MRAVSGCQPVGRPALAVAARGAAADRAPPAQLPSAAAAPAVVLLAGALPRARRRPGRAAAAGRGARRAAAARAPAEDGPRRRAVGALLGAWWAAGRAGPAAASPALASLQADEIDYVVDGDTVKLKSGTRVRLIGVNTPETVAPKQKAGAPPDCYGPEASSLTKSLLPKGTKVRLESDAEPVDRFGRSLAYVYREQDGLFINAELVKQGAARHMEIKPNVRYAATILQLEKEAAAAKKGLWQACPVGAGKGQAAALPASLPAAGGLENPGDTKNCKDFASYDDAKAWFDKYFPLYGDVAKLDGDGNGKPCEALLKKK